MNKNIYKKSGVGYDARSGTYGEDTVWSQPLNPLDPVLKEKIDKASKLLVKKKMNTYYKWNNEEARFLIIKWGTNLPKKKQQ
jgi:hypothetical protein